MTEFLYISIVFFLIFFSRLALFFPLYSNRASDFILPNSYFYFVVDAL